MGVGVGRNVGVGVGVGRGVGVGVGTGVGVGVGLGVGDGVGVGVGLGVGRTVGVGVGLGLGTGVGLGVGWGVGVGARVGTGLGVGNGVGLGVGVGANVGLGVGVGVGAIEGVGVGRVVGTGLGVGVGTSVGVGVAVGVGVGLGVRVGVGVGVAVGVGAGRVRTVHSPENRSFPAASRLTAWNRYWVLGRRSVTSTVCSRVGVVDGTVLPSIVRDRPKRTRWVVGSSVNQWTVTVVDPICVRRSSRIRGFVPSTMIVSETGVTGSHGPLPEEPNWTYTAWTPSPAGSVISACDAYTRGNPQLTPSSEKRIMRGSSRSPAERDNVTR